MKLTLHINSDLDPNTFLTLAARGLRSVSDEGEAVIAALEAAVDYVPRRDAAYVAVVLAACGGNVAAAARSLGVARSTVRRAVQGAKPVARVEAERGAEEWGHEE